MLKRIYGDAKLTVLTGLIIALLTIGLPFAYNSLAQSVNGARKAEYDRLLDRYYRESNWHKEEYRAWEDKRSLAIAPTAEEETAMREEADRRARDNDLYGTTTRITSYLREAEYIRLESERTGKLNSRLEAWERANPPPSLEATMPHGIDEMPLLSSRVRFWIPAIALFMHALVGLFAQLAKGLTRT